MIDQTYGSDNLEHEFTRMIQSGIVNDRRMSELGPEVQIYYPEKDLLTDWLPVGQHGTSGACRQWCPRVGENVVVMHYPECMEQGVVVCSTYTENNPAYIPRSLNASSMQP